MEIKRRQNPVAIRQQLKDGYEMFRVPEKNNIILTESQKDEIARKHIQRKMLERFGEEGLSQVIKRKYVESRKKTNE